MIKINFFPFFVYGCGVLKKKLEKSNHKKKKKKKQVS